MSWTSPALMNVSRTTSPELPPTIPESFSRSYFTPTPEASSPAGMAWNGWPDSVEYAAKGFQGYCCSCGQPTRTPVGKFLDSADPWLIAYAQVNDCTIVTSEAFVPPSAKKSEDSQWMRTIRCSLYRQLNHAQEFEGLFYSRLKYRKNIAFFSSHAQHQYPTSCQTASGHGVDYTYGQSRSKFLSPYY